MPTQSEKALAFCSLHKRDRAFLIPNPWDLGTTRVLERMGFEALASTSAGFAFSMGKRDTTVGRDPMLVHLATISAATNLPVSADLENGFSDDPEQAADTIRLAAAAGVVGGSIEDASNRPEEPIYSRELAVERIRAATEAARSLPFPFLLTARAENYLVGRTDLKDTIERLQSYQEAGADVLYAPGLIRKEDIGAVVRSVDRPVNVLAGIRGFELNLAELSELGVKRVSVGSGFARAAVGAFLRAAEEIRDHGTFSFSEEAASFRDISDMLEGGNG